MFGMSSNGGSSRGAPAPASPFGLLNDDRSSRKAAARLATIEQHLSVLSAILGLAILVMSWRYFSHFTETAGQVLGGLLVASGGIGYMGGRSKSSNLSSAQLIACLVGMLLAFNLVSEVVRDTQVDCALAELYHTGKATQRAVAGVAQQEALQSVFLRLNEMEDSLTMVQTGAAKQVELRQEQQNLKSNDLQYIRSKLAMVKAHAEELLNSVLKNPNVTVDNIQRLSDAEKAALRKRMDTADSVIERITKHHAEDGQEITFEEYQEILAALDATVGDATPDIAQAKSELANFKAALERSKADSYSELLVGSAHRQLHAINERRRQQQEKWSQKFQATLAKQQEQGTDFLADLPAHCVKETAGERVMVSAALVAIVLQLATAYVALSLSLRLPVGPKAE